MCSLIMEAGASHRHSERDVRNEVKYTLDEGYYSEVDWV